MILSCILEYTVSQHVSLRIQCHVLDIHRPKFFVLCGKVGALKPILKATPMNKLYDCLVSNGTIITNPSIKATFAQTNTVSSRMSSLHL